MLPRGLSRFHLVTAAALLAGLLTPWPVAVAVGAAYVALVAAGVAWARLGLFLPVVCRARTERPAVALTFDDGPDPAVTPALLALLKSAGVRATFFCIGERLAAQPSLARQIVAAGHLLGNHSYQHRRFTNLLGTARLREDIRRAQALITSVAGQPPRFFRPPMGLTNPRVARVVRELGLTAVGWSAGGSDQGAPTAAAILARLRRGLRPGAIILLHDAGVDGTVWLAAVEQLLAELRQKGLTACRLDELLP